MLKTSTIDVQIYFFNSMYARQLLNLSIVVWRIDVRLFKLNWDTSAVYRLWRFIQPGYSLKSQPFSPRPVTYFWTILKRKMRMKTNWAKVNFSLGSCKNVILFSRNLTKLPKRRNSFWKFTRPNEIVPLKCCNLIHTLVPTSAVYRLWKFIQPGYSSQKPAFYAEAGDVFLNEIEMKPKMKTRMKTKLRMKMKTNWPKINLKSIVHWVAVWTRFNFDDAWPNCQ